MDTDCLCSMLPFQRLSRANILGERYYLCLCCMLLFQRLCRANILGGRDSISLETEPPSGQKRPEITPNYISSPHQDVASAPRAKGRHGHCPLYEIHIPQKQSSSLYSAPEKINCLLRKGLHLLEKPNL